jgi:pimeloyl-ACP methyl ester carboxylesterase
MKISLRLLLGLALICAIFYGYTAFIVWQSERNYPPVGSFLTKNGQSLHYVKAGAGPPLILIHGDGGSLYDWKLSCFDTLARQFTTIAIDRPGLGYSSTLANQSIEGQADFLHTCLADLTTEKPVLICHSRGAEVGICLALKYPNDLAGLITLGGACFNTQNNEPSWQYKLLQTPLLGPLLAYTVYVPASKPFIKMGMDKAFSPDKPAPQPYVDTYAALLMKPQQVLNWAKDQDHVLLDNFLVPNYKNLKTPLVIVNGDKDANLPLSFAQKFHRMVPGSLLITVPNTGHELHFNKPESVFAALDSLAARKGNR